MARLIIGHVTHETAKIWVRGGEFCHWAKVCVFKDGKAVDQQWLNLEARHAYTGCLEFKNLKDKVFY